MTPKASAAVTVMQNNLASKSDATIVPCKRTHTVAKRVSHITPQEDELTK